MAQAVIKAYGIFSDGKFSEEMRVVIPSIGTITPMPGYRDVCILGVAAEFNGHCYVHMSMHELESIVNEFWARR